MWTKDCNPGYYNKKKIAGSKLRIPVGYPGYQRFSFSHVWGCVCASQQIFGQRTKPRETKPKVSVGEAYDSKLAITVKQNFLIYLFIFFTDTCNFIFQVLHTLLWLQKKGRQFFIMLTTVMIRWENSSSFFPSETKRSANPEGWHIFTGEVVSQRFWAMNVNRKCYFALLSRDFEQIFGQIVSIKVKTPRRRWLNSLLGNLSEGVFERRTSTGRYIPEQRFCLNFQLNCLSKCKETKQIQFFYVKALPVDVSLSKTPLLKLPANSTSALI